MFTKDFKKLRLVLLTAGSLALFCIALNASLMIFASWAEVRYNLYPFREEDYVRSLVPSLYEGRGQNRLLLAGPSEAREGLLDQPFNKELGGLEAFNAAQSVGTLDDLLVTLEYIEKVYGDNAKPKVIVVGITPRFIANIRSGDDPSPLVGAINKYSPFFQVKQTNSNDSRLAPKNEWEGLLARARFLSKQPVRYRPAVGGLLYEAYSHHMKGNAPAETVAPILERYVAAYTSPHRLRDHGPWSTEQLQDALKGKRSFWTKTSEWNPTEDATRIEAQLTQLKQLATKWRTQLYVVNLPEHPMVRETYKPGRYEAYLKLTRAALGDTPFLDLRGLLDTDEFYDLAHPTPQGAEHETELVVQFVKEGQPGVAQASIK